MICSKCSVNVSESDRFCSHCGHPLELVATNSVDARNGKIEAPIFQVGGSIFYNPEQPESFKASKASYDAVPKWRSPVTQGVLSWVGLVLGLAGVFPLWKVVQPLYYLFPKGGRCTSERIRAGSVVLLLDGYSPCALFSHGTSPIGEEPTATAIVVGLRTEWCWTAYHTGEDSCQLPQVWR